MDAHVKEQRDDIRKGLKDKRSYRGLILDNDMKVLLIHDRKIDRSAVALDVLVGYMDDPPELPGLAHLCQHMLLLGTRTHSIYNIFDAYITQNNGKHDASTYLDHTVYNFEIIPEKLQKALHYFAECLLNPLFPEDLMEREVDIIHSEYLKNLQDDNWRYSQLDKLTANPLHPFTNFGTGNKITLETVPRKRNIDVRKEILKFYAEYYVASKMTLCVLGKENLDSLQKLVVNDFHKVRNKKIQKQKYYVHPYQANDMPTIFHTTSVENMKNLIITFPLLHSCQEIEHRAKPTYCISYILEHGENGLLSFLRSKNWCNTLVSGKRSSGNFKFFCIAINLTDSGFDNVNKIIESVFQYFNVMKDNKNKIVLNQLYEESRYIIEMNFNYGEKFTPRSYVISKARALQNYPITDVLCAEYIFFSPDSLSVKTIINCCFQPKYVRIQLIAKNYEKSEDYDMTEYWYRIKYKIELINEAQICMWMNSSTYGRFMKLPSPNKFITDNFNIVQGPNVEKVPEIVTHTSFIKLWFKQDIKFLIPKADMIFNFVCPNMFADPCNIHLAFLFVELFCDSFKPYPYATNRSGLIWELSNSKTGITLAISGFNQKQYLLLEKIMTEIVCFQIDSSRFQIIKNNYIESFTKVNVLKPHQQAIICHANLLTAGGWMMKDIMEETVLDITASMVDKFVRMELFDKVYVECFIHGNMTVQEAKDIGQLVESKLKKKTAEKKSIDSPYQMPHMRFNMTDSDWLQFNVINERYENSCILFYYDAGMQSTKLNMLLQLTAYVILYLYKCDLKNGKYLDYTLSCNIYKMDERQGLRIIIYSGRMQIAEIQKEIRKILGEKVIKSVRNDAMFKMRKNMLAVLLDLQKSKTFTSVSATLWDEILTHQCNFDQANSEISCLNALGREEFIKFYREITERNQYKLSVHVQPSKNILQYKKHIEKFKCTN